MTTSTVLEQIRKLVELQKLDGQIYDIKRELEEKPAALNALKEEFEAKKANLAALEEQNKNVKKNRDSLELDLKSKEDAVAKANTQLSQIKTNKEYTAKLTEIEGIKADMSIIEEKILKSYDEADAVEASRNKEKALLAEEEKKYAASCKDVEDAVKALEDQKAVLEGQRQQITPGIDKSTLTTYEKTLVNKQGAAIVPVLGAACGGCFMNVPAQVVNEIKMHERLVTCEMCTRILYLEEEL